MFPNYRKAPTIQESNTQALGENLIFGSKELNKNPVIAIRSPLKATINCSLVPSTFSLGRIA
jgi:hypothetical protein